MGQFLRLTRQPGGGIFGHDLCPRKFYAQFAALSRSTWIKEP
jgi:hypothetical protein